MLACGQAAGQGTYGTKVNAGDPDVGLPLSTFSNIGGSGSANPQWNAWLSFWDIGSTPGLYDNQDVVYLQFGSAAATASRIVRTNNIRITGWGSYAAGSYVKPGDSDLGQQLLPWFATFPAAPFTGFYYMEVDGVFGYSLGDPVYLKAGGNPSSFTDTNDIRISTVAGLPAGSRVSLSNPDATRPLDLFYAPAIFGTAASGPYFPASLVPIFPPGQIASLAFFNANGNIGPGNLPVYDDGDVVYFDTGTPLGTVTPNDVRLY